MPLLDAEDARNAWARASFTGDPAGVRRRIVDICLKKGIRLTPSMATQAIAEEIAAHNAREGADDSNTLRFTVHNEADLTRACETAREKLKGKGESMSTNFQQRHDTPQGQSALQQIHDTAARHGAVCQKPANLSAAEFVSKHESAKIQEAHDLAVAGGARCNQQGASPFFSGGEQPTLRDPKERARAHVEKRNKLIKGEGAATTQAELSEPKPSSDPQEAARERARAAARKHIERRNRQIEQEKKNIRDGKSPYWWRGR
jgi:hypothetical protein